MRKVRRVAAKALLIIGLCLLAAPAVTYLGILGWYWWVTR